MTNALTIAKSWQDAANRQAVDELLARSSPAIEIIGPRGSAHGHEVLKAWLGRAGLSLTTKRLFARDNNVVAEQRGVWRSPENGAVIGEADVATWFRVSDGQVDLLARYDTLAEALAAAGLSEADLVESELAHE